MPTPAPNDNRLTVFLDGAAYRVDAGVSIAAAYAATGITDFSTDVSGKKRGLFCGMGVCHECLVNVNGRTSQRACMTPVTEGMQVVRQSARPDIGTNILGNLASPPPAIEHQTMDLLVIGAGPAGLSAALAAAGAGASVVVVDERTSSGGQFYKQPVTAAASERLSGDKQAITGADLVSRAEAAGVTILSQVTVWGAATTQDSDTEIACYGPQGAFYCHPKMLVIATGAFERPAPLAGWTLAGVMTTGAAQTLLRSYATLPGKRILIAGNGPLNIQVASEIVAAGGNVVGVVEQAAPPWRRMQQSLLLLNRDPVLTMKGVRELARLKTANVPIFWETSVSAIHGHKQVETVTLSGPSGESTITADTVLLGGNFTSSSEVSRLLGCAHSVAPDGTLHAVCKEDGESSLAHIHIVGEAVRFGGAHVAMAEGRLAGLSIASKLGLDAGTDDKARQRLLRAKAFQSALWQLFSPVHETPPPGDDAIICRCEGVTLASLKAILEKGPPDVATLKRLTRAGMGRCQGRYCSHTLSKLGDGPVSETQGFLAPQMPLRPVPLAAIAVEKPEWGGHKRALLPDRSLPADPKPLPVRKVETLIIGAGIAGLSTALFLAEAGENVVVVDRAFPGGLASGGNAGSLHAQLLSFDHGTRSEGGGGPAARTLPLQRNSIALWQELEQRLGRDFEMKITGGLMVAETEAHMRFLEEKAAVERSVGVECHVIGRDDLMQMEPALSDAMIGAAYCPEEGKINPLVATRHIQEAAEAAGAVIYDRTGVSAMRREKNGFAVETSRGVLLADRIVNAAGAFAARVGAMLGLDVPVFGAPLQMVVTEAAAPAISRLVAHADRHLTLKQAANGNFLIGGGWTAGLDPVHGHPRPDFSGIEGNLWVAQHVVPGLRKLHVIRSWAAMNINIDGAPILGEHPAMPGFFNAVTSNGFTLGPIVGQTTAALVTGRNPDRDLSAFSISRFK